MVTAMVSAMLVRSRLLPLAGVVTLVSRVPANVVEGVKLSVVRWAPSMICLVIATGARECKSKL
jgi:hypothetical protein